jgi:hypothetical protein
MNSSVVLHVYYFVLLFFLLLYDITATDMTNKPHMKFIMLSANPH